MPLPKVRPNEKQKDFISRCAGDKLMNKEYPDAKQRVAICYEIYRRALKKKRAKGSEEEPTWEEIQAEIEQSGTIQCDGTLKIINLPKI